MLEDRDDSSSKRDPPLFQMWRRAPKGSLRNAPPGKGYDGSNPVEPGSSVWEDCPNAMAIRVVSRSAARSHRSSLESKISVSGWISPLITVRVTSPMSAPFPGNRPGLKHVSVRAHRVHSPAVPCSRSDEEESLHPSADLTGVAPGRRRHGRRRNLSEVGRHRRGKRTRTAMHFCTTSRRRRHSTGCMMIRV